MPMLQRGRRSARSTSRAISSAAATQRSAWSAQRGRARRTPPSSPSPTNLFAWPPCSTSTGTTQLVELVEPRDRPRRAPARSANAVKPRMSRNSTVTSTSSPCEHRALREHAVGEHRVDERAERLAQLLALAQPGDHLVERRRRAARSRRCRAPARARRGRPRRRAAVPRAQVLQRLDDRARQQQRQLERDRERDARSPAGRRRRASRGSLCGAAKPGDDDAGDDVDRRQRDEQPPCAAAP